MTDSKKKRERAILDTVYDCSDHAEVLEHECPDFLLRHAASGPQFGVEITEFHLSGTHARLRRIPGYVAEILNTGRFRHVADRASLKVDEVIITPPGGEGSRYPAIIQRLPDLTEQLRLLATLISKKSVRARKYRGGVTHVNLIVFDNDRRWATLSPESLSRLVVGPEVRRALWRAPYREVFFVTHLAQDRLVYLPLVLLLLLGDLYATAHVAARSKLDITASQLLNLFARHAARRARVAPLARGRGEAFEVLLRGYGLLLDPKRGVIVHDNRDHPMPSDARPLKTEVAPRIALHRLGQMLRRHHAAHDFVCGLVTDVKAKAPWM